LEARGRERVELWCFGSGVVVWRWRFKVTFGLV
jgi:hypothetical protein